MISVLNFVFTYFKITRNNFFLILHYNKSIKIFNIGSLSIKNRQKSFSIIVEAMFSKVVDTLKK